MSEQMLRHQKVQNVERDPRIVLSLEGRGTSEPGLREYLVVHGSARVQEGGAAILVQEFAHVYMGPGVVFPPPGQDQKSALRAGLPEYRYGDSNPGFRTEKGLGTVR